jgi:hypothetical protein
MSGAPELRGTIERKSGWDSFAQGGARSRQAGTPRPDRRADGRRLPADPVPRLSAFEDGSLDARMSPFGQGLQHEPVGRLAGSP